ncbi:MAG: HAD-IC family P-type ATPase [Acidimicrobiia bacterium]|nr:HAD-IC family P-type ATPase [Acidimicrobiia bacterium]
MTQSLTAPRTGLTEAEVSDRVARGEVNRLPHGPSRTTADIFRANILTRFNLLITILLVVILFAAPLQDALFGIVMIVNAAIGIIQEMRAKATLDRLRLINAPQAVVIRSGQRRTIDVEDVVKGDVIEIAGGDQIVVDGRVITSDGLEVDESLLSGEAAPVTKQERQVCRSGSFVVAGRGTMLAERVGSEAYAPRLAAEAKQFTLVESELRNGIDLLLTIIGWGMIPIGLVLVVGQLSQGLREAASGAVAGLAAMIPQGLVLLTSVAFAVAVVRLGRRKALVQELAAVETLARVDTICLDKTGTLTEGKLRLVDIDYLADDRAGPHALGALARVEANPNATARLLAEAHPDPRWQAVSHVPFSSARKWSGAVFAGRGTWLIGAPEVLAPGDAEVRRLVQIGASEGFRMLLLARSEATALATLPTDLVPVALIAVGDRLRHGVADTLRFFRSQGVDLKVISGDHPATVSAIARAAGVRGAGRVVDGADLPSDEAELAGVVERGVVFGRITPHRKRALIRALQANGHVVAMTGDGVNDVLALKDADIGIAMGSGSAASRAVAQLVLLDGSFSVLPEVVAEGRRVIANIERVANLFLTKTVYAAILAIAAAATQSAFPFLPRHLTLVGSLTIGIPGFFLALEATSTRSTRGFLRRVWRFAVPTGILAAVATFVAYGLARSEGAGLAEARTTATFVLFSVGLFALIVISRPLTTERRLLVLAMATLFWLTLIIPGARFFYELPLPRAVVLLAAVGITAMTGALMYSTLQAIGWARQTEVLSGAMTVRSVKDAIRKKLVTDASPDADPTEDADRADPPFDVS